ncbi:hypothetical protein AN958_11034 [Leucoagaricus sp. SymC.cos]|nr:hypothetical protein AN958_11034 [Leucoagaricus sp. SymC.cos]
MSYHYRSTNEAYYDQLEENNLDPSHAVELARRAAQAFRQVYDFDEDKTVVMDFACGVGLLSQELISSSKSIVGIDISKRMVDEYNHRAENQGLSVNEMHALRVDILNPGHTVLQDLDGSFDVIVCSASYHHLDDIVATTRALFKFLKPGGTLLIMDLLKDDSLKVGEVFPEHGEHNIVAHRGGFAQHQIEEAFSAAGFSSFAFKDGVKAKKKGHPVTLFIARGLKPGVASHS